MNEKEAAGRGSPALTLLLCLAATAFLQALREGIEYFALRFVPREEFAARMVTMGAMLLLAGAVLLYARLRRIPLRVFPARFGRGYIIFTCVAAALLLSSPSNYLGGCRPWLLAFYGCVVTPVYEELLFRGLLWERLNGALGRELCTYICSVALFTLWHLGYILPQLAAGEWVPVLWKLAAGLGYGIVLGFVRIRTGCCYAAMLTHALLNLFMV